jgi:phosphate transport system permease protein
MNLYRRRIWINRLGIGLSMAAMTFGLLALSWILWILLSKGFSSLSLDLFTKDTPAPGSEGGGLRNAIVGSGLIILVTTLVSTPIGILAGIYLAEFGKVSRFAMATRFVTDIMLSAPSIVVGLFVYALMVVSMKSFSGWAGSVALSLIAIPVVVRTTENMLTLVPASLREAAFAVGAPRWAVSIKVTLRAVKAGIVTGVLLAIARVMGETAPLLFTALNNQFFSSNMSGPMGNLPVVIFQFGLSPYESWNKLAWGGSLLIALLVLGINIGARVLFRQKDKV